MVKHSDVNLNLRQIVTYVDFETFNRIEEVRGRYSRSAFVASVLADVFEGIPEQEGLTNAH